MITIHVNGAERQTGDATSLDMLLQQLGLAGRPVVVELNGTIVARDRMPGTILSPGDKVEIVRVVGGG